MTINAKAWKRQMTKELLLHMVCHPVCLFFYGIFWFHFYSLCQFGRIRKNLPVLALCLLFFLFWITWFFIRRGKNSACSRSVFFTDVTIADNVLYFTEDNYQESIDLSSITAYRLRRDKLFVFAAGSRFYCSAFAGENVSFLKLKLSSRGFLRHFSWMLPSIAYILFITLAGSTLVAASAMPYNGKLSWYLERIKHDRTMEFVHDNLYEDGIDGLLLDIRTKVTLPETLCLSNSFQLHFLPDGTIQSLDTMLMGFDERGIFTDTYLISYNASRSEKITVTLDGYSSGEFDPDKDIAPLAEGLKVIPLQQVCADWPQSEFGILYYGVREWYWLDENVFYISNQGQPLEAGLTGRNSYTGYSISVYLPEGSSSDQLPYRYLYLPEEE